MRARLPKSAETCFSTVSNPGTASQVAERFALYWFVSGHGFSRAERRRKYVRALALILKDQISSATEVSTTVPGEAWHIMDNCKTDTCQPTHSPKTEPSSSCFCLLPSLLRRPNQRNRHLRIRACSPKVPWRANTSLEAGQFIQQDRKSVV